MKPLSSLSHVSRSRAPLRALLRAVFRAAALVLAAGCGADEPAPAGDPCAEILPDCLSTQMTCAVRDGAAQCEDCPQGNYVRNDGKCEALGGTATTHEFTEFTVKAGEEIKGLCQSWTIGNAEELWVNAVELTQDQRSHHSIWTFVPQNQFAGPDGVWPCADRNYNELVGTLAGGVLYAQSTQAVHEVQRFPEGSAIRIPPYSKIIGDVHLLNTTGQDVTGNARLSLYSIPKSDVSVSLVPFEMAYRDLKIPPHAKSRFGAS
ncbi:MAG TPA: hypothetical protein VLS89_20140, partial [Candidatus Nanopelagicales bacterium]|nr:hypothetical protein [Candidatus Nanopelagicales bacterium]